MTISTIEFLKTVSSKINEEDGKKFVTVTAVKNGVITISGKGWTLEIEDNWLGDLSVKYGSIITIEDYKPVSVRPALSGGRKSRAGSGCEAVKSFM